MNLADIKRAAELAEIRRKHILDFEQLRAARHAKEGALYATFSTSNGYLSVSLHLPREVVLEAALTRIDEVDRELMALGVNPEPFDREIPIWEGGA